MKRWEQHIYYDLIARGVTDGGTASGAGALKLWDWMPVGGP